MNRKRPWTTSSYRTTTNPISFMLKEQKQHISREEHPHYTYGDVDWAHEENIYTYGDEHVDWGAL